MKPDCDALWNADAREEADCLPGESDCATLAVSKSIFVNVQERIVES